MKIANWFSAAPRVWARCSCPWATNHSNGSSALGGFQKLALFGDEGRLGSMGSPLPEIALLAQGFAMCAHRNQRRKHEDAPYVVHCERVARVVAEYTDASNVS